MPQTLSEVPIARQNFFEATYYVMRLKLLKAVYFGEPRIVPDAAHFLVGIDRRILFATVVQKG